MSGTVAGTSGSASGSPPVLQDAEVWDFASSIALCGVTDIVKLIQRLVWQAVSDHFASEHYYNSGDNTTGRENATWTAVHLFGSSSLGAAIKGSDIDLLLLTSETLDTNVLFDGLPPLLTAAPQVEDVLVVRSARVPLIKCHVLGVKVDLIVATSSLPAAPDKETLLLPSFLLTVDQRCRGSANGVRTALEVARLVPESVPYAVFACCLMVVKRWAVRRRVYGNLCTYPNGVTLAIMMTRVAQLAPTTSPTALLRSFFRTYRKLLLRPGHVQPIVITGTISAGGRAHVPGMPPSWTPSSAGIAGTAEELLPVINPAFPYVNAAHMVGRSGFACFYEEIVRADNILNDTSAGSGGDASNSVLDRLTAPATLLLPDLAGSPGGEEATLNDTVAPRYAAFMAVHIEVSVAAPQSAEALLAAWEGMVMSRVRLLIYALECYDPRIRPLNAPAHMPSVSSGAGAPAVTAASVFLIALPTVPSSGAAAFQPHFELFVESVRENVVSAEGANTHEKFVWDANTMRMPWFTLHRVSDSNFPPFIRQYLTADVAPYTEP